MNRGGRRYSLVGIKNVGFFGILVLLIIAVFLLFPIIPDGTYAADDGGAVADGDPTISIAPIGDLIIPVNNCTGADGTVSCTGTMDANIEVTTGSAGGYSLYMNTETDDNALSALGPSTSTIASIADEYASPASFPYNTWGYTVDGGATYLPIPTSASSLEQRRITTTYGAGTGSHNVQFAAKTNFNNTAGRYENTIVFSAVINPIFNYTIYFNNGVFDDNNYTPLEYIEGKGTQYIDTGVIAKDTIIMQTKLNMTEATGGTILGQFNGNEVDSFRFFNYSQKAYLDFGSGSGHNRIYGGSINNGTTYNLEIGNRYVKDLDLGTYIIQASSVGAFTKSYNIYLFQPSEATKGKVYYLKIYDGETLVRDMVPVARNADGVVGMYDLVNSEFYAPAVGTFNAGPEIVSGTMEPQEMRGGEPKALSKNTFTRTEYRFMGWGTVKGGEVVYQDEEVVQNLTQAESITLYAIWGIKPIVYQELEYIKGTGTQWLDTEVLANSNIVMQLKFNLTQPTGDILVGAYDSENDSFRFFAGEGGSLTDKTMRLDYGDSEETSKRLDGPDIVLNTDYEIEVGNRYIKNMTTGEVLASGSVISSFQKTYTIGVFYARVANRDQDGRKKVPAQAKMYSLKIYDNGVLVRDMIPVRQTMPNGDTHIGMFDDVNQVFYDNQGTGTFVAGPDVAESEWEE